MIAPSPKRAEWLARMPMIQRVLVAEVRDYLSRYDMTLLDFATDAGIGYKYLQRLLTGRQQGTLDAWQKVLDAMDCVIEVEAA